MHLKTHQNLTTLHHSNFTQVTHSYTESNNCHSRSPYNMPGWAHRGSKGVPPTNSQPSTRRWRDGLDAMVFWTVINFQCLHLTATAIIITHRNLDSLPFCIWATFLAISRIICILHFSALDKSRHSDARYGLLSFSFPVSLTWAALHRAKVVLKPT